MPHEQTHNPAIDMTLRRLLAEPLIDEWIEENLMWPGFALALATIMYSVMLRIATPPGIQSVVYFGGELVGAGGPLLAVVMSASAISKITRLKHIAAGCPITNNLTDKTALRDDVMKFGNKIMFLQITCVVSGVALAGMHVQVEHSLSGWQRAIASMFLLGGNILFVSSAAIFLRSRLLELKRCLMLLEAGMGGISYQTIRAWEKA